MADNNSRETRKRELKRQMISPGASNEDNEQELKKRQKKRKKIRRIILIIVLVLAVAGATGAFFFIRYYKFSSYTEAWVKDLSQGSLVGYEQFGDNLLKYSRDGVTCLNRKGEEVWTESYEMKNPIISVNGKFACIADQQGNSLEVFGEDGRTGKATTLLPITKAAVSGTGVSAMIGEDAKGSYITFFKNDGTALDITIKTKISGDGYPTDLALSPDGTRLMVSYEFIEGGEMKGRVVFYDFSEIGKNIPNRLVGGFDEPFAKSLLASVRYMNGTFSVAAADTGIYFFTSKNLAAPAVQKELPMDDEIESVFGDSSYEGVVLKNAAGAKRHRLELYKNNGSKVFSRDFDGNYKYADTDGGYIFLYGTDSLQIYNMAGVLKFESPVDYSVMKVIRGSLPNEFILAGASAIRSIHLR
jgi:hypothetical protein